MADLKGKALFNSKMGKARYSKGGYIKRLGNRQYFDTGGIAQNAIAPPVTGGNLTNTNTSGIGGISQALGLNAASANITPGTNVNQLNNAYTGANNAINNQIGIANTLTPGVQTGANTQNQIEQQELAMTQGAGPNPAQAQLAQATGTNVANQAALAAGQRGGAANVGLMERQAAQTGAQTQQAAAGQAATLEAQQQIAAQNNAANIAAQQVGQGQGATSALNQAQQNEQSILQNANTSANNAAVGMQSNINNVNAQANQGILGGVTSGLSSLTGGLLAKGGEVHPVHGKQKLDFIHKMAKMGMEHYDGGGTVTNIDPNKAQSISDSFKGAVHNYADGGITANPLVGAITGQPMTMAQGPGYMQSQASNGPNIASTPESSLDLGQNVASGYAAGQKWKANRASKDDSDNDSQDANDNSQAALQNPAPDPNAGLATSQAQFANNYAPTGGLGSLANPSSQTNTGWGATNPNQAPQAIVAGGLGSDQYAKGGEIWNLHPSQHAQYAATHFANYFAKGGEAKEVEAMVSPKERYWNPDEVEQIKHGADPRKLGIIFPGKDKIPGKDSLKNDVIPTKLREGGIVSPLHIEKTKDPDKMRLFVLKSLKATGRHMKKPMGMK